MTKEEILDYVVNSPENTNRRVLSDMLDEFNSGSGGSTGFVINGVGEGTTVTLNKTWQEIYEAFSAGQSCVIIWEDPSYKTTFGVVAVLKYNSTEFRVCYVSTSNTIQTLDCDSADGYPAARFD